MADAPRHAELRGEIEGRDWSHTLELAPGLLTLRDPVAGLEVTASVCEGRLIAVDAIDLAKTLRFRRQPIAVLDGVGRPWW